MSATAAGDFRDDAGELARPRWDLQATRGYERARRPHRKQKAIGTDGDGTEHDGTFDRYHEPTPGSPLGAGYPSGRALRIDGDSHREWWMDVIRMDPCSFCREQSTTVDHIVPRATGLPLVERWSNMTGACQRCNNRKRDRPLLLFLLGRRGVQVPPVQDRSPGRVHMAR